MMGFFDTQNQMRDAGHNPFGMSQEQYKGFMADKISPWAQMGMTSGLGQAQARPLPIPQADSRRGLQQETGLGGLMAMATANANRPAPKGQAPMNPYVQGLMMRGM